MHRHDRSSWLPFRRCDRNLLWLDNHLLDLCVSNRLSGHVHVCCLSAWCLLHRSRLRVNRCGLLLRRHRGRHGQWARCLLYV